MAVVNSNKFSRKNKENRSRHKVLTRNMILSGLLLSKNNCLVKDKKVFYLIEGLKQFFSTKNETFFYSISILLLGGKANLFNSRNKINNIHEKI